MGIELFYIKNFQTVVFKNSANRVERKVGEMLVINGVVLIVFN
jgi:hypothetical protein